MTLRELADRYIALREDAGYKTQRSFAAAIGINYKTIDSHENGRRPMSHETLIKYADFFGVSTDFLLGRTNVKSPNAKIRGICNRLGLSEEAVLAICRIEKKESENSKQSTHDPRWALDRFLCPEYFVDFIRVLGDCLRWSFYPTDFERLIELERLNAGKKGVACFWHRDVENELKAAQQTSHDIAIFNAQRYATKIAEDFAALSADAYKVDQQNAAEVAAQIRAIKERKVQKAASSNTDTDPQ